LNLEGYDACILINLEVYTIYFENPRQEKDIRKLYKGFFQDQENLS